MNTKEKIDYVVKWLCIELEKTPCKGFVIGVSGGIDSAVVSTLCAMTGKPTVVVKIPYRAYAGSAKEQFDRARDHTDYLKNLYSNIEYITMDFGGLWESFWNNMAFLDKRLDSHQLAAVNSKSRLRMVVLYHIASSLNYIVVGTGNKVEDFGVGFFTKWGDGGVDLSPIGDLYKSEVYEFGKELGVSQNILDAVPTDGLWSDGRSDEQQLGATYDELEWVMKRCPQIINDGYTPARSWFDMTDRQYEVILKFIEHRKQNKHKMKPIPICKIPE